MPGGAYAKRAGLWFDPNAELRFTDVGHIDLGALFPSVSGPRRPQDRLPAGETGPAIRAGAGHARVFGDPARLDGCPGTISEAAAR